MCEEIDFYNYNLLVSKNIFLLRILSAEKPNVQIETYITIYASHLYFAHALFVHDKIQKDLCI
jgi:hypothetical protein